MPNTELLFTDRVPESVAFADALAAHRDRVDNRAPDQVCPGRNVLVFHGMGGLGKSRLSKRLQEWVSGSLGTDEGWGLPPSTKVTVTARLNFHGSNARIDPAQLLFKLRAQLGVHPGEWRAFDIAFATYWASTRRDAFPLSTDNEMEAGAQVTDAVRAVIGDGVATLPPLDVESSCTIAHLIGLALGSAWSRVARSIQSRRELFPAGYEDLLVDLRSLPSESDSRPDLVARLAGLISFAIAASSHQPLAVIFIDTFEHLEADARREGEDLLNRVAWAMPNVLFVVTGRNALRWWELDGLPLTHRGPRLWPLLVPGVAEEPRQHRIGALSSRDTRTVLEAINADLSLELAPDLFDEIVEASAGNPKYLELVREVASIYQRNNEVLTKGAVAGSLEILVEFLMEDIPPRERRALYGLALLGIADAPLLSAAADLDVSEGARALRSSLVDVVAGQPGFYTMHDSIREIVLSASAARIGWLSSDWRTAGTRALAAVRLRWTAALDTYRAATYAEHANEAGAAAQVAFREFGIAVRIVCAVDAERGPAERSIYGDWVTEGLVWGPSITGLLSHVPAPSEKNTAFGRLVLKFIEGKQSGRPSEDRERDLAAVANADGPIWRIGSRHLAYSRLNRGEWDLALETWAAQIKRQPEQRSLADGQVLNVLLAARRYADITASPGWSIEKERVGAMRRIEFDHGRPQDWLDASAARLEDIAKMASHNPKDRLERESTWMRHSALITGLDVERIDGLRHRADAAGHEVAFLESLVAGMLAGHHDLAVTRETLMRMDRARNGGLLATRSAIVRASAAYLDDDEDELKKLRAEANKLPRRRSRMWIPTEALMAHVGHPLREEPAQWQIPIAEVYARWAAIWLDWKTRRSQE